MYRGVDVERYVPAVCDVYIKSLMLTSVLAIYDCKSSKGEA